MDWNAGNGDVLKRIIALLLALAGLAERATGMPRPIRYVVLRILRRAEIAGRKVVAAEARDLRVAPWLPAWAAVHGGDDAMGLALCFRLLALALSNLSSLAHRFPRPIAERSWQDATFLPSRFHRLGTPVAPDTS